MKAIVYNQFGPPDVLHITEVQRPDPSDKEVLIRIHATTVEKEDPDMRAKRGLNGILRPKRPILGLFFSGEVVSIGAETNKFKVGDEVFGSATLRLGTYAEYICLSEDGAFILKPDVFNHQEAVAILNGVLTALPFLREKGRVSPGQRVLINGASGSVGTMAVQIAKHLGAHVTGVCSNSNLDLVQSLGADRVIDYLNQDFTQMNEEYDVIFDTVGKTSFSKCKKSMTSNGVFLTTIPGISVLFRMLFDSFLQNGRKARFTASGLRKAPKKIDDLNYIKKMIENGEILPVIDKIYPMDKIAEAHIHVAGGHKRGSVVIII